ncbi:polyketide cyclase [Marmoricola endophyticus]|uniref:Polyketide cyclase n=1 Tax=Marmoricola endophyticus TaxID=2040280 RepID=A0A917F1B6_9ACTN|nr:SRPBCC family protein [Marmoricola endophyticus]GGF40552.1 polyketide cyclase [Marmoricola endophyticus]
MSFRFTHSWDVTAARPVVYDVLRDVAWYPAWWPQVRAVAFVSDTTGRAVCRSLAPLDLDLWLTSEREDPDAGVLGVRLEGDLEGWCRFELSDTGTGTHVDFRQEVEVCRPGLARAARVLGPALRLNHAWMMRGCRRGLARRVS